MIKREKIIGKISVVATATAMTFGMISTFSHEANATGSGYDKKIVLYSCESGYYQDCEAGSLACTPTTCP